MPRPDLEQLCKEKFDLLIVGGGINGAGVARDASLRGMRVLLVEKADFGFGTSSRSTKLVHGGLRYLEHYEFGLVKESLRERAVLTRILAPHLVRPRSIMLPLYEGDQRPPWMIKAGLFLYDFLAGSQNIGKHKMLSRDESLVEEPGLSPNGLMGSGLYWDCQMNDARLVLENILAAKEAGAVCLNACELVSAHATALGDVRVKLRDSESGVESACSAKVMVNAAGPWVDEVLGTANVEGPRRVKPSKGIHLVTPALTHQQALLLASRKDSRVFFVIPWDVEGRKLSMIGTTESDFNGDKNHVRAENDEVDYLISETRRVLPGALANPSDVLATYAGLRPLAAPTNDGSGHFKISREAVIHTDQGVLSITGGKYTSYRHLAEDVTDRCERLLKKSHRPCITADRPLPGAEGELGALAGGFEGDVAENLRRQYGSRATEVAAIISEDPSLRERIHPDCSTVYAQAVHAARHEMVTNLSDFYLRRTFLGLATSPEHQSTDRVASLIGKELGWSRDRETKEMDALRRVVGGEYR